MKEKLVRCLPPLLVLLISVTGCSERSKKEGYIKAIIKTGLSEREDVLANPDITSYRVIRDGTNDGVCYEYTTNGIIDMDAKMLKKMLVEEFNKIANQPTKVAIKSGIYLRFVYKSARGEILGDQILTSSDFGW